MGFVVEARDWSNGDEEGEPSFSAFVFESNTEGEKVHNPESTTLIGFKQKNMLNVIYNINTLYVIVYSQICYTINLAKEITEAKKVTS